MKVLVLGAGGPVAACGIAEIEGRHELRLADLRPLESDEHDTVQVDVSEPQQVIDAAEGMEAIVNCTVMRPHPTLAWDVNLRGAFNALKAAAHHGIKRFIHTGPIAMWGGSPGSYLYDFDVNEACPHRPGTELYFITKYLGLETCKVFADRYGIQVVAFHYNGFGPRNGSSPGASPFVAHPEDVGQAFRLGLEVESLPSNFELFHISSHYIHGQFPTTKAEELLGFVPRHDFSRFYRRVQED
ncbi:MAG: NAD-dependent epimerase/dehydratase family protein [Planctomycetota bacterium]|jgi:nucleoside-diphosphate-sugar epimerase|nr:NAD-dependent epimerase/dehydratase family protein [Planctomycetota bacterium]